MYVLEVINMKFNANKTQHTINVDSEVMREIGRRAEEKGIAICNANYIMRAILGLPEKTGKWARKR